MIGAEKAPRARSPTRRVASLGAASATAPLVASLAAFALAVAGLCALTRPAAGPQPDDPALVVYCAASVRPAIEPILRRFEATEGVRTLLQVGASGALESQIRLSDAGDLFIPAAADPFLKRLEQRGYLERIAPIARVQLVLAYRQDDSIEVDTLRELIASDLAYGLCNQQAAAGQCTRRSLDATGLWDELFRRKTASMMTVTELAGAIRDGGRLRAGIIWNTTAAQFGLRATVPHELAEATSAIGAGVLAGSHSPEAATRLSRLIASPDGGRDVLIESGYLIGPAGERSL